MQCEDAQRAEGVLAHETGHMAGGHVARSARSTSGVMGPMLLGLGLGILAAAGRRAGRGGGLIY